MVVKGLRWAVVAGDSNNISLTLSKTANRQTDSELDRLPIQENSKQQNLSVYTDGSVTKDQSGWGFTAKQDATSIHEDSVVYSVPTSSLTMEVEEVTHALHQSEQTLKLFRRQRWKNI